MTCLHCHRVRFIEGRGLCRMCHHKPEVRCLYAKKTTHTYGHRGLGDDDSPGPLPDEVTGERPGTEEKILAMQARAARSESLFHYGDNDQPPEPRTPNRVADPDYSPCVYRVSEV